MIHIKRQVGLALLLALTLACRGSADALEQGWENPPTTARLRAYWWWLNGDVTPEAIARDLEQMKAKGFGGAVIIDAGGAEQEGNDRVPHGPTFFSPAWRELYKHALRQADRLGLEMSLNVQSGWNLGGPSVTAEDAAKKLVFTVTKVSGAGEHLLPEAKHDPRFYRDVFVVAYKLKPGAKVHRPIKLFEQKAMYKTLHFSAPDTSPLLEDVPAEAGEEDAQSADVIDLTGAMNADGKLHWDAPPGDWEVIRFGATIGDHAKVSTCSDGWQGYALDPLDGGAFQRYWDAIIEPLILDAGPLAGKTLKYLHTDSWEVEAINWTPTLRQEFKRRRGYDLLPFAPVLAGKIVDGRLQSNRFLNDFRKTLGDLAIDNHYRLFRDNAHKHGMQIHCEAGGPHAVPIDAQRCLGWDDAPMSEFWAWSWEHRIGDANRFFVKQPASAAHTYGHPLVVAEGFTSIGPHWQERLSDNLKPAFDKAVCEGVNLLVWHAFVCSPKEAGLPGNSYFAGTHFNPNSTWWEKSGPFLSYINRCQWMLQRGLFVADVCYYYGDHVPNFAQLRSSDPAHLGAGYDYDVITEEALLTRAAVKDGRIVLPDGMSYGALVLADRPLISLAVLKKVADLVKAGATVIGPRPTQTTGLTDYLASDAEVSRLVNEIWGPTAGAGSAPATTALTSEAAGTPTNHASVPPTGPGALTHLATGKDFNVIGGDAQTSINYLHRRDGATDIYFVANLSGRAENIQCAFRVVDKAPELWDAVSGGHRFATTYSFSKDCTTVPLKLAPFGSTFVVLREPAASHPATGKPNQPEWVSQGELAGPWQVTFDPKFGGPDAPVTFDRLVSWTSRPEPGIRYYSGTAVYRRTLNLPKLQPGEKWQLDLGDVRELAEVKLNGKSLGILWSQPFRAELTPAAHKGDNLLEIEVVNFWPNRIIGDYALPPEKRLTRTNITKLTSDKQLMDSGLLGPIQLMTQEAE